MVKNTEGTIHHSPFIITKMPLEINTLNIHVNLEESGGNQSSDNAGSNDESAQQALVDKIVEQVLAILKDKMER